MKKKFVITCIILSFLLVLAGALYALTIRKTSAFAGSQIQNLQEANISEIYDNLVPEIQNKYASKEDFMGKFTENTLMERIAEIKLESTDLNLSQRKFEYKLTRADDPLSGYHVVIVTNTNMFDIKIKDISVYEDTFNNASQ